MQKTVVTLAQAPHCHDAVLEWCYREWWETPTSDDSTLREALKEHLADLDYPTTLVALHGNRPVGSVHLIERDFYTDEHSPCLAGLYVLPGFRGVGLGKALIESVLRRAHAFGFDSVYLATRDGQELYERLGWRMVGRSASNAELLIMASAARK